MDYVDPKTGVEIHIPDKLIKAQQRRFKQEAERDGTNKLRQQVEERKENKVLAWLCVGIFALGIIMWIGEQL